MSEHYYSKYTNAKSDERTWSFLLRGTSLTFTTDHAVFSKGEVDLGSRLLIEAFEMPVVDGDLLDLGCGYGPIGLSLAKDFSERHIWLVDVNERALELSRKNARQNQLANVSVKESDRFSSIKENRFAAILTNPPIRAGKRTVHAMFEGAHEALVDEGELWVVIQKKQGAPSAKEKLGELFGRVEVVVKRKGYYILKAKKV
ncbi:class I SAM-dependent methyltransferase [Halobacillus amylolyticus]|uniref:Class I SAM-dependent methyltransferase n=1 Tax=Halobacillus amylolyticus TaxID=2932259 RepID=A0ABY4H846_9BACI|nr:class I SAM-dependent methyltransferase [Halobacillus amylolyticus]UOR10618.1 class I SAM-dependent methyltransferase [Halobacillus amylolyticus]